MSKMDELHVPSARAVRSSSPQRAMASTYIAGPRRLGSHVKREIHRFRSAVPAPAAADRSPIRARSRTCATDRRRASGLRNDTRISSVARLRYFTNLRSSSGLSTTNAIDAVVERGADVAVALDGMGVNAAFGRHSQATHQIPPRHWSPDRKRRLRPAAVVNHRGMRQRLHRVVKSDARQGRGEPPILGAHALGIDHEQRRAVARHQMLDRLARERVLRRIELQRIVGQSTRIRDRILATNSLAR